ncbi:hypothetical protein FA13DRAFT_1798459 [Coprinellus micaceus]|uniref:Uncharacterized protein n=1 Tax=Coprinellus micaceus TaxID=71717 RepID=A0A4Y7SM79_COPMI|nr:hypothetical protein FA13DRAFT_1798459 [Coprinellus micaceus]
MARPSETLPPSSPITTSSDLPGSDPPPGSSDDSIMAERYNRLLHSKSQKKRKHDGEGVSLTRLGRGIRKTIDLYADIDNLIILADAYEFSEGNPALSDGEDEEDEEDAKAKAEEKLLRKRAATALKLLVSSVPNIDKALSNVEPQVLTVNLAQLQRGANDGRSEDTSNLRGPVGNWVSQLQPSAPPLLSDDKAARGLQHDKCGELLSSVEHDWSDLEVRRKIRSYEAGYESSMFARALYAGYSGDPKNLEEGFLKSSMMVKAFKHIFTSPKSSQDVDVTICQAMQV